MKKTLLLAAFLCACVFLEAQIQTPAASPPASVSTQVGLTDITINYYRPRAKGRKIFGTDASVLVPYGKIWRTGANNGTRIKFSDDVTVEGKPVKKGEYLIFTWPGANEWTVSLYKDLELGGNTGGYKEENEAARFTVKPGKLSEKVDAFTINITDIAPDNSSAKIELAWENTSVKFGVGVSFDEKVMASIKANTQVNPGNYFQAAVYYLETGKDLKQALEWINKAAEANPNAFWISHQKAKIQKALGDKAGAKATATASLESAKKAGNRDYEMMNQDLIKSLN